MKKLIKIGLMSLTIATPAVAEMSYEEAFLQSIHICKNEELYKQGEKEAKGTIGWKVMNCFCDNFKEYEEDEILRKYLMATELGIPQMDLAVSLNKAQECVNNIK